MWNELPEEHKKRFNTIVFVAGPICCIVGFVLSTKVARLVGFQVDLQGIVFVFVGMLVVYIISVLNLYRYIQKKHGDKSK